MTVDYGVRYSLYPPITDANNVLTSFLPSAYVAANAPKCANAACTLINVGTGDPLNGIIVAGKNSPFGDAIYAFDKGDIQPRIGVTWDPKSTGRTIFRTSYGVYYDQALVGIFEQNSFTNPPYVNTVSILNPKLSNPGSGTTAATTGVLALIGNGDDFKTPRTQQWNAGIQQQLYSRGALEVSYVGAHGDHLIRPIDINYPNPADVLRLGSVNLARPYQGYGAITQRMTTARSNYWGILSSFRHNGGAAGSLTLNYTLSRNRTDASNDRDAIDIPQDPNNIAIEYADARTDRRHIFTANYVYEIPFLKDSPNSLLKAVLGRLADRRPDGDQLGPADSAYLGEHQRLPPRRPSQHRRRPGGGRPDRKPVLVQPERLRAGGRRHLRQLGALRIPAAWPQPDRPVAVEELDVQRRAALPVPDRRHQCVQPHAVAGRPQRERPRQYLHHQPDDVQSVERYVRTDPEYARAARNSARVQVLLVRRDRKKPRRTRRALRKFVSAFFAISAVFSSSNVE